MLRPLTWYGELARVKGRREQGAFVVEGPRAVAEVARLAPSSIIELLVVEGQEAPRGPWPVRTLSRRQFGNIAVSRAPQGIMAVVAVPAGVYGDQLPPDPGARLLLCEHVQDPGNIGTLIRGAAAFGFSGVLLSHLCADPFGPKAVQGSAGAILSLWVRKTRLYLGLAGELRASGYTLVAADAHGGTDVPWSITSPCLLALGSEGTGLSAALRGMADRVFTIPIDTTRAESLNVAAAGAIAMYRMCGQGSDGGKNGVLG